MQVFLFTQPTCPQCPAAKDTVNTVCSQKNVPVTEIDVKTDEGLLKAIEHNILATPTALVVKGDTVVKRFSGTVLTGELEACLV